MTDARYAALARLVDDAGLFPPAQLPMAAAVAAHRRHRGGPYEWLLGRFLCPSSRLDELATELQPGERLAVGVVLDPPQRADWVSGLAAAVQLVETADERLAVEAVELRLPADRGPDAAAWRADVGAALDVLAPAAPAGRLLAYLEVPRARANGHAEGDGWATSAAAAAAALGDARADGTRVEPRAKVRCGGVEPAATPTTAELAAFVAACRDERVPFKATAGLHHPLRGPDAESGRPLHGFLNLLAAAAIALDRDADAALLTAVLEETDPASLRLDPAGIAWRAVDAGPATLARTRDELFVGFGSCSFDEPVGDLIALGVLPLEPR